ncbi:response regulator [Runella sp. SP2]|uniref:response regulator n=1 Tax=Runella sp. SP2 TaxID=2268026 RepID=UPI000F078EBB|nr:response regulator [Runella sp. SP2]AYQ30670.1 response regulator [Runella sp. SP2]
MKILVVDDEHDIKTLFEQRFRREIRSGELNFNFAYSGEEALAFLGDHLSEVVLILSDINMPGMSGIELLKRIRSTHPSSPPTIMMITAYNDEENYKQAKQFGADDFLNKPIDFTSLKQKLFESL